MEAAQDWLCAHPPDCTLYYPKGAIVVVSIIHPACVSVTATAIETSQASRIHLLCNQLVAGLAAAEDEQEGGDSLVVFLL